MRWPVLVSLVLCTGLRTLAGAQQTPVRGHDAADAPALTAVSPGVWRMEGDEPSSKIHYVRIFLIGSSAGRCDTSSFRRGEPGPEPAHADRAMYA